MDNETRNSLITVSGLIFAAFIGLLTLLLIAMKANDRIDGLEQRLRVNESVTRMMAEKLLTLECK